MLLSTKRSLAAENSSPTNRSSALSPSSSSAKRRQKPFTEEYIDNLRKIYLESSDIEDDQIDRHKQNSEDKICEEQRTNKQLDFDSSNRYQNPQKSNIFTSNSN